VADKAGEAVGMAAFDVAPAFWNRSVLLARELLWYVEPAHRQGIGRQMLQALEAAADQKKTEIV
jgi:GNAT superfamily N-acetyltransferase